jgi:hypothetical protein
METLQKPFQEQKFFAKTKIFAKTWQNETFCEIANFHKTKFHEKQANFYLFFTFRENEKRGFCFNPTANTIMFLVISEF